MNFQKRFLSPIKWTLFQRKMHCCHGRRHDVTCSRKSVDTRVVIIRGYYMAEVCLLVILALPNHIGPRALARGPIWLGSANMT